MAAFGKVIQPGDPEWQVGEDNDAELICGAAFGPEMFSIAISLSGEHYYQFDNYCRFLRYISGQWIMSEVEDRIVYMIRYQAPNWEKPGLVVMSWEGQIVYLGDTIWQENIDDAGLDGNGYLDRIANLSGSLFVCGYSGQILRRTDNGNWVHTDEGTLHWPLVSEEDRFDYHIEAVDSFDLRRFYAVGSTAHHRGLLFTRDDDSPWQSVPLPTDTQPLQNVIVKDEDTVYLSSRDTILIGNYLSGFKHYGYDKPPGHYAPFTSMIFYRDVLYIACTNGLYYFDEGVIKELPGFEVEKNVPWILQVSDDFLWVFGLGGVARFDGQDWKYYHPPRISTSQSSCL